MWSKYFKTVNKDADMPCLEKTFEIFFYILTTVSPLSSPPIPSTCLPF